jgi:hypothetical protein
LVFGCGVSILTEGKGVGLEGEGVGLDAETPVPRLSKLKE